MIAAQQAYEAGERGEPFPQDLVGHAYETDLRRWHALAEQRRQAGREVHVASSPVRVYPADVVRQRDEIEALEKYSRPDRST